jgi:hypothetical protein
MRLRLALAAAAIAALVPCASASADAIVYMKNNQVWVAAPDGSNAHQVTQYAYNWRWPSMADDGTIAAAGGPGHPPYGDPGSDLYVFKGDGNLRNGPIPTPGTYYTLSCPTVAPWNVRISPDASKLAYSSYICSEDATALWTPSTATGLDWPNQNSGLGVEDYDDPYWTDSSHFLASHLGTTIVSSEARWFVHDTAIDTSNPENGWAESDAADASSNTPSTTGEQAVMSRDGTRLAIFEDDTADWIPAAPHNEAIWLYTVSGGALTWQCTIPLAVANMSDPFAASPSFSPDGSKLLWGDDLGVRLMSVGNLASGCAGHSAPVTLIPGGYEPFYSKGNERAEAANPDQPGKPAPTPTPTPSPTPTPTPKPTVHKPVARFAVKTKRSKRRHGKRIAFDGRKSSEKGGRITEWSWSFGDHRTAKGRKVTHRFRKKGTYKVKLTVHDATHHKASVTHKVKIR